ncbi:MAG: nuclear transport factor 2 family protein [Hyphomicrobiales bacterium]|nr:nuclear transport factor 2 family protein [Hyphomicrobiales bacterium]
MPGVTNYPDPRVSGREALEQRTLEIFDRRAAGDMEGMMALAAPDFVFTGRFVAGANVTLKRFGREACIELGRAVLVFFEYTGQTIDEIVVDGEQVAVRRTAHIRNRGTGKTGPLTIVDFLTFRDGLMTILDEYPDLQGLAFLGPWP